MPKPSTKNAQVDEQVDEIENQEENTVSSIECEDFDINRLAFRGQVPQEGATQYTFFPKYLFDEEKEVTRENCSKYGESLIVVTPPIKMIRGGIPKHNNQYHTADPDSAKRAYFFIPRNDEDPDTKQLFDMINTIDDYMDQEINVKKNKNNLLYTISSKTKKEIPTKNLTYKRMITKSQPPQNDEDEEDTNKKQYLEWERIKVKFNMKYDPELGQDDPREITTQLYLKDKDEPENFTKLTEIEKFFTWNCTARFALMFNRVWGKKSDTRECSIGIKCVQIGITEYAEMRTSAAKQLNRNLFSRQGPVQPRQNVKAIQNKPQKTQKKKQPESEDEDQQDNSEGSENEEQQNDSENEESQNEDQNNDSDDDNNADENEDSHSEAEESEEPPPKKGTKVAGKTGKTQATKGKGVATKNRK